MYLHCIKMLCQVKYTCYNNNNNNNFILRGWHIWHECQSYLWSSDTKTYMRLIITDRTKISYSMYRAGEVSVYRACCMRATQPYSLGGGGTICQGSRPAGVTTRIPRIVAECLPTRSMLIKMYYRFMVCACICTMFNQPITNTSKPV